VQRIPWERLRIAWNDTAAKSPKGNLIIKMARWTPTRKSMYNARAKEHGEDFFPLLCLRILTSPFLQGLAGKKRFRLDVDWALRPNNCAKILEGKYSGQAAISEIKDEIGRLEREFEEKVEPLKSENDLKKDHAFFLKEGVLSYPFPNYQKRYYELWKQRRSQYVAANRRRVSGSR
jgi:hypothetical protein